MFQPNQFHVCKPWRRPFETHTVISEGARPGSPLGLLQHSRRVHFLFLPSCFAPRTLSHTWSLSRLGGPSHPLLLQLAAEIGSGWVRDPRYSKQSQWWAASKERNLAYFSLFHSLQDGRSLSIWTKLFWKSESTGLIFSIKMMLEWGSTGMMSWWRTDLKWQLSPKCGDHLLWDRTS